MEFLFVPCTCHKCVELVCISLEKPCKTQVSDFGAKIFVKENVGSFDVRVDKMRLQLGVKMGQSLCCPYCYVESAFPLQFHALCRLCTMDTPVGQVISGLTHVFTTSSEPRCLAFLFVALITNQRDISRICVKGRYQTRLGRGFCCPYTHTPSSGWTRSGNRQEGALCWDGAHWQSLGPPSQIHVCLVGISVTAALLTLLYHLAGLPAVVTNQSRLEKVCL